MNAASCCASITSRCRGRKKAQLIEIRTGKFAQDEVFEMGRELRMECDSLLAVSKLPKVPDKTYLSHLVAEAYLEQWRRMGLCHP